MIYGLAFLAGLSWPACYLWGWTRGFKACKEIYNPKEIP